jgi:hypothetical protein
MDNKIIQFPSASGGHAPMGRPEPQLPRLSPRDLELARRRRAEAMAANRPRRQQARTWVAFGFGVLTARLVDLLLVLLR